MSVAGYVLGGYEPLSGTIRIPYAFPAGQNLVDDPVLMHEFVHHGQAAMSVLGSEYVMMLHELMIATVQLCRDTSHVRLPLSESPPSVRNHPSWHHAQLALRYLTDVIGGIDNPTLVAFAAKARNPRGNLVKTLLDTDRPQPAVWLTGLVEPEKRELPMRRLIFGEEGARVVDLPPSTAPPLPTIEMQFDDGQRFSFPIDGSFILETHARVTELFQYGVNHHLSLDERAEAFLARQYDPYLLPCWAVQQLIARRISRTPRWYDDALLICHMCCVIAMNWIGPGHTKVQPEAIETATMRFELTLPGRIFVLALSAALEHFRYVGETDSQYLSLFHGILHKIEAKPFRELVQTALIDELERRAEAPDTGSDYDAYQFNRCREAARAARWWAGTFEREEGADFVNAPLLISMHGLISMPRIVGTDGEISAGSSLPWPGQMHAEVFAFLTRMLWSEKELRRADAPVSDEGQWKEYLKYFGIAPHTAPLPAEPAGGETQDQ